MGIRIDKVVRGNIVDHEHLLADIEGLDNPLMYKGVIVNEAAMQAVEIQLQTSAITPDAGWMYKVTGNFAHNDSIDTHAAGGTSAPVDYVAGDILTVDGGTNGTILVDTVDGTGAILTYTLIGDGNGYTVGDDNLTTAVTGIGTGFKLNITATYDTYYQIGDVVIWNSTGGWDKVDEDKAQSFVYYVGKHGSDNNTGKTISNAFLTIGQAITAITAQLIITPAVNFVISVVDAGTYSESIILLDYMNLYAPYATMTGTDTIGITSAVSGFCVVNTVIGTGSAVKRSVGTTYYYIEIDSITTTTTEALAIQSYAICNIGTITTTTGIAVNVNSFAAVSLKAEIDNISVTGAGTAVKLVACTMNLDVNTITSAGTAYDIDATSTLYVDCQNRTGTVTVAAGGVLVENNNNITTITTLTYNITLYNTTVLLDTTSNNVTVTLPNPPLTMGKPINIKTLNTTNTPKVVCASGNIEGVLGTTGITYTVAGESKTFISDGTDYWIV